MAGKIYLSGEEQEFLMDMLEISEPRKAAERFAEIITEERGDPGELKTYLKKIIAKWKEKK